MRCVISFLFLCILCTILCIFLIYVYIFSPPYIYIEQGRVLSNFKKPTIGFCVDFVALNPSLLDVYIDQLIITVTIGSKLTGVQYELQPSIGLTNETITTIKGNDLTEFFINGVLDLGNQYNEIYEYVLKKKLILVF